MQSSATTVKQYIAGLPVERKTPVEKLRNAVRKNLPKGFEEVMGYGMIGYVVPHSIYPDGYHCDPKQPLPFMNIASQKHFIAVYSMGLYTDKELLSWFETEYAKRVKGKLDMGKSCIRFKKMEDIPYDLIGELSSKVKVEEWIENYERALKK